MTDTRNIPPPVDRPSPPPPPAGETETITSQLDIFTTGLDPEQEIRAQAAAIAGPPPVRDPGAMVAWDSAVVTLAAWIRTGERP